MYCIKEYATWTAWSESTQVWPVFGQNRIFLNPPSTLRWLFDTACHAPCLKAPDHVGPLQEEHLKKAAHPLILVPLLSLVRLRLQNLKVKIRHPRLLKQDRHQFPRASHPEELKAKESLKKQAKAIWTVYSIAQVISTKPTCRSHFNNFLIYNAILYVFSISNSNCGHHWLPWWWWWWWWLRHTLFITNDYAYYA